MKTTQLVFAVPGQHTIIDTVRPDGRSAIYNETLDEVRARYPGAVLISVADWQAARTAEQDEPVKWEPIEEDRYWYFLEALPPACLTRLGFLVGEPIDHHAGTGAPRYQACIAKGGQYFASSRPMTRAEFAVIT
jgi:hypothetical protein